MCVGFGRFSTLALLVILWGHLHFICLYENEQNTLRSYFHLVPRWFCKHGQQTFFKIILRDGWVSFYIICMKMLLHAQSRTEFFIFYFFLQGRSGPICAVTQGPNIPNIHSSELYCGVIQWLVISKRGKDRLEGCAHMNRQRGCLDTVLIK